MSGALAAALQSGCCCGRDGNGGGGGGTPDDCGPSGPGAASDRATTAIAVSLDLQYEHTQWSKYIWSPNVLTQQLAPASCESPSGPSCSSPTPNLSYNCNGFGFYGNYSNATAGGTVHCYNYTGHRTRPVLSCPCRTGACAQCGDIDLMVNGATAIAEQDGPQQRAWTTYQSVQAQLPRHSIGQFTYSAGQISQYTYALGSLTYAIRQGCILPDFGAFGVQQWWRPNNQGQMVYTVPYGIDPMRGVACDPFGRFVRSFPGGNFASDSSRWGNSNIGTARVHVEVHISYINSLGSLGPGWLAQVGFGTMYQEQYLDMRHRFEQFGQERFRLSDPVPTETGYPFMPSPITYPIGGMYPIYLWKPCLNESDTVVGTYSAIWGPGQTPSGDPSVRTFEERFSDGPTCINQERRRFVRLQNLSVS